MRRSIRLRRSQELSKILNSSSEDDSDSKRNTKRENNSSVNKRHTNVFTNSQLQSDNYQVLNDNSSVSDEQNSQWWQNLSENDNVKLPNKLSSFTQINDNAVEEQMYHVESDENENSREKMLSIFASKEQRFRKSRYSKAFSFSPEKTDKEEESNSQNANQNMDIEDFKNTIESPVSQTNKMNKKRRTKSLFKKKMKKNKRKYSDAFIPQAEKAEIQTNIHEEQKNLTDMNESLQKRKTNSSKLDNKKKKFSEALLNIWDDESEKHNNNNSTDESIKNKRKELFKVTNSKRNKYSEAFLNNHDDDNKSLEKQNIQNFSAHNLSEEPSQVERKMLFKSNFENRKYSQVFMSMLNDSSDEEIDVQKDSSKISTRSKSRKQTEKSTKGGEIEAHNSTHDQSNKLIKDLRVNLFRTDFSSNRKYSEAFAFSEEEEIIIEEIQTQKDPSVISNRNVNVSSRKSSNIDNNKNNEKDEDLEIHNSISNQSKEMSKVSKVNLFRNESKNRKYSEAFATSNLADDTIEKQIVTEEETSTKEKESQKNSTIAGNRNLSVTNRKTRNSNKQTSNLDNILNVNKNDEDNSKKDEEFEMHNSINKSKDISKIVKVNLFRYENKMRKYSEAFVLSNSTDDSSEEEIVTENVDKEKIQKQYDVSNTSKRNLNVTNKKTRISHKQSREMENVNEDLEKSDKKELETNNSIYNQSKEMSKVSKVNLFRNEIKNRKYSEAFALSNLTDESIEKQIDTEETPQKKLSSVNVTNRRTRNSYKQTSNINKEHEINTNFAEEEIIEEIETQKDSSVTNNKNETNIFPEIEETPIKKLNDNRTSRIKIGSSKKKKELNEENNENDSQTNTALPEKIITERGKGSLNKLKNSNTIYSQAYMELIAMSKPVTQTQSNVEDKIEKLTDDSKLQSDDSDSKFSTISSINISSELKHPLFRPKSRKSLNSVKSINESKNQADMQSDQEQSKRKSSIKTNSSKFASFLESEFNPILSSTKLLTNFTGEKSTGSDESIKKKQALQDVISDNEKSRRKSINTPSKMRRKTTSLTTVPEKLENILNDENDSNIKTQDIINNKNPTPSTSFKSKNIHENSNENSTTKNSTSKSVSKMSIQSDNKKKHSRKREKKSGTISENVDDISPDNDSKMLTNYISEEPAELSVKSIEDIDKTIPEEKNIQRKKSSIVTKSHSGSVIDAPEKNSNKTMDNDTVVSENLNKLKEKLESLGKTDSAINESSSLKTKSNLIRSNLEEILTISSERKSESQKISEVITINSSKSRVRSSPIEQWLNNSIITGEIGPEEIVIVEDRQVSSKELDPIIKQDKKSNFVFPKSKLLSTTEKQSSIRKSDIGYRKDLLRKAVNDISKFKPPTQEPVKKITDFFSKLKENEKLPSIPKSVKRVKKPAAVCTARLIDGKPYYSKKLFRGKYWCSPNFYKFLQKKLSTKYGEDTINESEKVMKLIFESVNRILKSKKYIKEEVDNLKRELAIRGIIETTYDFYCFCFDYLPAEYRNLVIPQTQGLQSSVPYNEDDVFKKVIEE